MINGNSREEKGKKVSIYLAIGNLGLFTVYVFTGMMGNSIAVLSEGVDNLIDACSSLLLLLGFKISGRGKDNMHPKGHGRIEYVIGLLISELILFAGFALGKESLGRLIHPEPIGAFLPVILGAVIGTAVKLAMAQWIKKQNAELNSSALEAYRKNELADLKGILLIAITPVLQHFTSLPVDGAAGFVIAVLIVLDGGKSFLKNVSLLLGEGLNKEETEVITRMIGLCGDGIQLESLEFHDYGPEEKEGIIVLSVSPVVPDCKLQQIMNECKEQIQKKLNIQVFIYVNPNSDKVTDKPATLQPRLELLKQYFGLWTPHAGKGNVEHPNLQNSLLISNIGQMLNYTAGIPATHRGKERRWQSFSRRGS